MGTSTRAQTITVFISLLLVGYLTGLFIAWSAAVMPGLATTNDQTFVAAIQGLETRFDGGDQVIPDINGNWPTFLAFFTGPIWCFAALVLHRKQPEVARLIGAAFILLCIGVVTSVLFNVPSNIGIVEAGDPTLPGVDASVIRAQFGEERWVRWNNVRAATATLAFCLLAWSFRLQASPPSTTRPRMELS